MEESVPFAQTNEVHIIAVGINSQDLDRSRREFRNRGFGVIADYVSGNNSWSMALKISPVLFVKLALECNLPVRPLTEYTKLEILEMANEAVQVINRGSAILKTTSAWCAHNESELKLLDNSDCPDHLFTIASYYGTTIGTYFAWLSFYTSYLYAPTIVGLALFLHQLWIGSVDSIGLPLFSVFIAIWGTCFQEFWKRRNAELSFAWNVFGSEDSDGMESDADALSNRDTNPFKLVLRLSLTSPFLLALMYFMTKIMLYYIDCDKRAAICYGDFSMMRLAVSVGYAALPPILGQVLSKIVEGTTEFEDHSSKSDHNNHFILKSFAVQFVNFNVSLFYVTFWLNDLNLLRGLLGSLIIVNAIINNMIELGLPIIESMYSKNRMKAVQATPSPASTTSSPSVEKLRSGWVEKLEAEASLPSCEVDDDYLEMVIQFAHVTMFAVAFPLAPALALLNNMFEGDVDLKKYSECQRPVMSKRATIGAWNICLEFVSFVSIITNCYLLVMVSSHVHLFVPQSLQYVLESPMGRGMAMVGLEHVLIGIRIALMFAIDDVPQWIQDAVASERTRKTQEIIRIRKQEYAQKAADHVISQSHEISDVTSVIAAQNSMLFGEDGTSAIHNITGGHSDLKLGTEEAGENDSHGVERRLAATKIARDYSSQFGFNPVNITVLVCVPLLLSYLQVSIFLYVPCAIIFFYYFQVTKDRQDRKSALGIVSDPQVLKFILDEMPSWVTDSESQRVEWLNSMIQKLWFQVSTATETIAIAKLQPIIDQNKPSFLPQLVLEKMSLGTMAPKITGIRFHSTEESIVRMDIELRWAANLDVILRLGTLPLPTSFELKDFRLSATVRVELTHFIPTFPCIGAMSFTCMKKPFIDFSFTVASLDMMNIGTADFSLAKVIKDIIHSSLANMAMYPKKQVIQIAQDIDLKAFLSPTPVALLQITIQELINYSAGNWLFGTRPFVEIRSLDQIYKTSSIKEITKSTTINETLDIIIYDKATQIVEIVVYDGNGSILCRFSHKIDKVPNNKPTRSEVPFNYSPANDQFIAFSCLYWPLSTTTTTKKTSAEQDVIFANTCSEVSEEVLTVAPPGVHAPPDQADPESSSPHSPRISQLSRPVSHNANDMGVLQISFVRCKNLRSSLFLGLTTALNVFLQFKIESNSKSTGVRSGLENPGFDESFTFIVHDPVHSNLVVKVMNQSQVVLLNALVELDSCVGELILPLNEVMDHQRLKTGSSVLEKDYILDNTSNSGDCLIGFRMQWSSLQVPVTRHA